jgi:putative ABC transport system permease protein
MKNEARIPFFLIWRFLKRTNKWTLLLIVFLMSAAFLNLVFVNSLFTGVVSTSNKQVIETSSGDITITPGEGQDYIDKVSAQLKTINRVRDVTASSPMTLVPASLKYKNIEGSFAVNAIDPVLDRKALTIAKKVTEGSYLDSGDTDKILIGKQVAGGKDVELDASSFKGARAGDRVTLSIGAVSKDFTVKGVFYTKYLQTDVKTFITTRALYDLLPQLENEATTIVVRTRKNADVNRVIRDLRAAGVKGNIAPWQDSAGLAKSVNKSFITINALLTTVGFLIAAVTIFIIIYVDITHRRQEIGILRAIGIKSYLIRSTYVLQAVVYSVFGVLLGCALFFGVIVPYFHVHPFAIPIGDVTLMPSAGDFIARAEAVIAVAIASALVPSIIVTRAKILDEILGR